MDMKYVLVLSILWSSTVDCLTLNFGKYQANKNETNIVSILYVPTTNSPTNKRSSPTNTRNSSANKTISPTNQCNKELYNASALYKNETRRINESASNLLEELSNIKAFSDEDLCHVAQEILNKIKGNTESCNSTGSAQEVLNKTKGNTESCIEKEIRVQVDKYMVSLRIVYNILRRNTLSTNKEQIPNDIISTQAQSVIGLAGNSISIISLLVLLHVYYLFKELPPSRRISTIILSFLLLSACLLQIISFTLYNIKALCVSVAIGQHWVYLSTFSLTLKIASDFYATFGRKTPKFMTANRISPCQILAWFFPPTLIVIICTILHFTKYNFVGYGKEEYCFILGFYGNLISFSVPVAAIIVASTILLSITGYRLHYDLKATSKALQLNRSPKREFQAVLAVLKVSTLLSLPWLFGVIAALSESPVVNYAFLILNSLQGFFVFVAFCCNKRVLILYRRRLTSITPPSS